MDVQRTPHVPGRLGAGPCAAAAVVVAQRSVHDGQHFGADVRDLHVLESVAVQGDGGTVGEGIVLGADLHGAALDHDVARIHGQVLAVPDECALHQQQVQLRRRHVHEDGLALGDDHRVTSHRRLAVKPRPDVRPQVEVAEHDGVHGGGDSNAAAPDGHRQVQLVHRRPRRRHALHHRLRRHHDVAVVVAVDDHAHIAGHRREAGAGDGQHRATASRAGRRRHGQQARRVGEGVGEREEGGVRVAVTGHGQATMP